jgi:hypothetical protein
MSVLSAFTTQLLRFFQELSDTFPEEREIRVAKEAIDGAKKINPRLLLDLFDEHMYKDLAQAIYAKDVETILTVGKQKIDKQFNEISPALSIFNKYWHTMGEANQTSIWQYLTVLCRLSEKAKA